MNLSISDHIYMYELKPEVQHGVKCSKDKTFIQTTISAFCALHGTVYEKSFLSLKRAFQDFQEQEKVILFENEKIYYHTYNVLRIIYLYLKAIDFYNSENYKNTFAGLRGDGKQILDQYHQHRANTFDTANAFKGDNRIKAIVFRSLYSDREATDLFLNFFTLYPIEMFKTLPKDQWKIPIIKKIIEHFSNTYIASEEVIYKSLTIYLNAYFRLTMGINSKHSKKITSNILYELFGYTFSATSSDMLRSVYISGRLDSLAIFKHAKDTYIPSEEAINKFDNFFNELYDEFDDINDFQITAKDYFSANPVKQFLLLKPMEFLQEIQP